MKLSIYLAMKQSPSLTADPWSEIDRHYRELEARVEQIQFLCRPIQLSRVTLGLDLLIDDRRESWTELMAKEGRTLEFIPPGERAIASFDVANLGRALDSFVAWRASDRSASGTATLRWWVEAGYAHVAWEEWDSDPQPEAGLPADEGSAWTLPLLARVILAHGGDYQIQTDRGWRLKLAWPSESTTP